MIKGILKQALFLCLIVFNVVQAQTQTKEPPKCLYVSSYHQGYEWSDDVQEGLMSKLAGHCEIRQFDMDTKRKKRSEDKMAAALQARQIIEQWRPDVLITSDDNAARHRFWMT